MVTNSHFALLAHYPPPPPRHHVGEYTRGGGDGVLNEGLPHEAKRWVRRAVFESARAVAGWGKYPDERLNKKRLH